MQRKLNKHAFLIGAMLFSTLFAFLIIDLFPKNKRELGQVLYSEASLKKEIIQLESHLIEFQDEIVMKDEQLDMTETLLDQKYTELDIMTQKAQELKKAIDQLEKEGKTDKQALKRMEEQLTDISESLLSEYKSQISELVLDLSFLNRREDSLKQKNEKINRVLLLTQSQYQDCMNGQEVSHDPVKKDSPEVTEMEFDFQVKNIRILSFEKSGKLPRPSVINTKGATKLDIEFDFAGIDAVTNHLTSGKDLKGVHKLYAVLKPINLDQVIVNPTQSKSGEKFMFHGKELTSSFPIMVNYQGKSQHVKAEYIVGKSFKGIRKGRYTLSIYWQDKSGSTELIGSEEVFFQ